MKHRSEIDGLRAIAVGAVVLNHAQYSIFRGGYVGVDIFFVISGFLICDIITQQLATGQFSVVGFYERRARRIVPALIPVLLLSLVTGYFTMLPDPFENLAQSVIATIFFSNNILLTITSGYWDLASHFKPMLHTWSLGVEEQFYFFFPLLALLLARLDSRAIPVLLIIITLLSFILSVKLTPLQPNASFYLIHTRAWELSLGGLFAILYHKTTLSASLCNFTSGIGLLFIIIAVFSFDHGTLPFPSFYATLPVLGSGLILAYGRSGTFVARILSMSGFVKVGLVSYSLYLWHQPIFVFSRILSFEEIGPLAYSGLVLLCGAAAYLSWRFVEQPFRKPGSLGRKSLFLLAGLSSLVVAGLAFGIFRANGIPERIPGLGIGPGRYMAYNERVFDYKVDKVDPSAENVLLVLGNSTARDFVNVALESGRFENYQIIYRDDIGLCGDISSQEHADLLEGATEIVATGLHNLENCEVLNLENNLVRGKPFLHLGVKHFGYNLNPYMFLSMEERPLARAHAVSFTTEQNELAKSKTPDDYFYDFPAILQRRFGGVPIFDEKGQILSADRVHLTEAGAVFFASFVFEDPKWSDFAAMHPQPDQ